MSDKQITTKLQLASKSSNLSLSALNLFKIPEKVFSLSGLLRLDISQNNIEVIPNSIRLLTKLRQFWANQNPIRLIPSEISECKSLQSLDLSYTKITELPRDLALIHKLCEIRLDGCPLNEKLRERYELGITEVWKYLQRKVDRKNYKEEVFRRLRESIYVGEDPKAIMELTLNIFRNLRDVDTAALKLFVHNMNRIFPEKIQYAFPEKIKDKIDEILLDLDRREELSELTLKLKSRYPKEDLLKVVNLAHSLAQNYSKEEIGTIFMKKLLPDDFEEMELPAITLNLTQIREKREHQIERAKLTLLSKLKSVYGASESIETLQAYADEFSQLFERFEDLRRFVKNSDKYLPAALKDFDSNTIFENFRNGNTIIN